MNYLTGKDKTQLINRTTEDYKNKKEQHQHIYDQSININSKDDFNNWHNRIVKATNKLYNAEDALSRAYIGVSNDMYQKMDIQQKCQVITKAIINDNKRLIKQNHGQINILCEENKGAHDRKHYSRKELEAIAMYQRAGLAQKEAVQKIRNITENIGSKSKTKSTKTSFWSKIKKWL